MEKQSFSLEICKALEYYVYRLIDPRNGETFYVGKGKDNRLFSHVLDESKTTDEDELTLKLSKIRSIKNSGENVIYIIHRHGLTEKEAFEIEGALIDAYPCSGNISDGHGNSDRGSMSVKEVFTKYAAEILSLKRGVPKLLGITINRSISEKSIYNAVRSSWKLNIKRAKEVKYVLAIEKGLIIKVYEPEEWLSVDESNCDKFGEIIDGRFGFLGKEASDDVGKKYIGKRVERKMGASNPIQYLEY